MHHSEICLCKIFVKTCWTMKNLIKNHDLYSGTIFFSRFHSLQSNFSLWLKWQKPYSRNVMSAELSFFQLGSPLVPGSPLRWTVKENILALATLDWALAILTIISCPGCKNCECFWNLLMPFLQQERLSRSPFSTCCAIMAFCGGVSLSFGVKLVVKKVRV